MIQRKFLLTLFALLGFAQLVGAKSVNTKAINIAAGETRDFYVYVLPAKDGIVSFQIDLKMPAGLTLNTDQCKLTSNVEDAEQELYVGLLSTNTYRVVSTSFNLTPLPLKDVAVLRLSVTADETFKGGTVNLYDMVYSTSASAKGSWAKDSFTVTTVDKIEGDVDFDGFVNVTDAMAIIEVLTNSDALTYSTMDINGDGEINVVDAMAVVDMILA